jgi:hypothetical protein
MRITFWSWNTGRVTALALALLTMGCASTAIRPPTPAAQLRTQDLMTVQPPPNERYYVMLFGSQRITRQPRYVHSWATVVKVTGDPQGGQGTVEAHTISWMPATLVIHPWRFRVEEGGNLELNFTIEEMLRHHEYIVMWGPYELWHGTYQRFMTQKAFMESGQVGYQCIDDIGEAARTGTGCDCIHAISDMDPMFSRDRYPLSYFGVPATRNIVRQIMTRPVIIDAPRTHDWLICQLGLDHYPIRRERYRGEAVPYSPEALRTLVEQGTDGAPRRNSLLSRLIGR